MNESIKTGFFLINPSSLVLIAASSYSPARDFTKPTFPPFRRANTLSRGPVASADDVTALVLRTNGHGAKAVTLVEIERSASAAANLMVCCEVKCEIIYL